MREPNRVRWWSMLLVISSVAGCAHPMLRPDDAMSPEEYEAAYYGEIPDGAYITEGELPEGYEYADPSNPPSGAECYVYSDEDLDDADCDYEYGESEAEKRARYEIAKKRCEMGMYRAGDRVSSKTVKCLRKGRDAVDTTIDDVGNHVQKRVRRIPLYVQRIPGHLRKIPVRPQKVALSCHPTPFYRGPSGYSGSYVRHLEMREHLNAERELLYGPYDGDPSGIYRASNGREPGSPRLIAAIATQKEEERRAAEKAALPSASAPTHKTVAIDQPLEPATVVPQRAKTAQSPTPAGRDDIPRL